MDDDDWVGEATGDPMLDQLGYQSPRQRGGTGFTDRSGELREHNRARLDAEAAQRRADRDAMRRRNALPQERPPVNQAWTGPAVAPQVAAPQVTGPQPGQHGAYFERRRVRYWWKPWRTRDVWQQVSAWRHGLPPTSGEVVTVNDVAALPGRVRTIGTVGENGTVVY